jgi:hypothetical protein
LVFNSLLFDGDFQLRGIIVNINIVGWVHGLGYVNLTPLRLSDVHLDAADSSKEFRVDSLDILAENLPYIIPKLRCLRAQYLVFATHLVLRCNFIVNPTHMAFSFTKYYLSPNLRTASRAAWPAPIHCTSGGCTAKHQFSPGCELAQWKRHIGIFHHAIELLESSALLWEEIVDECLSNSWPPICNKFRQR